MEVKITLMRDWKWLKLLKSMQSFRITTNLMKWQYMSSKLICGEGLSLLIRIIQKCLLSQGLSNIHLFFGLQTYKDYYLVLVLTIQCSKLSLMLWVMMSKKPTGCLWLITIKFWVAMLRQNLAMAQMLLN
jgi:hypothetical protein